MQDHTSLYQSYSYYFSQAVWWNALLFVITRSAQLIGSYGVYYTADNQTFFWWSHSLALLFLILLWIDFGFKKSIALFAHQSKNNLLPVYVWSAQSVVVFTTVIAISCCKNLLVPYLNHTSFLLFLIAFALNGMLFAAQNIYHAYFLNKLCNKALMIATLVELTVMVILCSTAAVSMNMLFAAKIMGTLSALGILFYNKTNLMYQNTTDNTVPLPYKNMLSHTGMMGTTTVLKSLSERNFLVPLFAASYGIEAATAYKLANETAIFFYRIIIKSLGTADTALLARAHETNHKQLFYAALTLVQRKTALLIIPLAAVLLISMTGSSYAAYLVPASGSRVIILARMLMACYFIESFFISYERVLEVKQKYRPLMLSYAVYGACLLVSLLGILKGLVTPLWGLMSIHGARIIGLALMSYHARKEIKR